MTDTADLPTVEQAREWLLHFNAVSGFERQQYTLAVIEFEAAIRRDERERARGNWSMRCWTQTT